MRIHNGHIIVKHDGKNLILDTGSPVSYPEDFFMLGDEQLSDYIGADVDGLLGMDFLSNKCLELDMRNNHHSIFEDNKTQWPADLDVIRIDLENTVPVVKARLPNNESVSLAIDTGAPISYMRNDIAQKMKVLNKKVNDFFPHFGSFETKLHEGTIEAGKKEYSLNFGVLPGLLENILIAWGVDGILGYEWLKLAEHITFNFPNNEILIHE